MTYKNMDIKTKLESDLFQLKIDSDMTELLAKEYNEKPTEENYKVFVEYIKNSDNHKLTQQFLDNEEVLNNSIKI